MRQAGSPSSNGPRLPTRTPSFPRKRESIQPEAADSTAGWIPAFAGMTTCADCWPQYGLLRRNPLREGQSRKAALGRGRMNAGGGRKARRTRARPATGRQHASAPPKLTLPENARRVLGLPQGEGWGQITIRMRSMRNDVTGGALGQVGDDQIETEGSSPHSVRWEAASHGR